jgi:hypothetical protein
VRALLAEDYPDLGPARGTAGDPSPPPRHRLPAGDRESPDCDDPAATRLVPAPSVPEPADQAAAAAAATSAVNDIDGRCEQLLAGDLPRRPGCGRITGVFVSRDGSHGFGGPLKCKRMDCPSCRALQITTAMRAAAKCILTADPDSTAVRVGVVWTCRTDWRRWGAISKAIRRAGPDAGHLRVRTEGGDVLIVSEARFTGAIPVTASAAALLVAECIETELAARRHAYRSCGRWRPSKRRPRWQLLKTRLGAQAVRRLAEAHGAATKGITAAGPFVGTAFGFTFLPAADPQRVADFHRQLASGARVRVYSSSEEGLRQGQSRTIPPPPPDTGPPGGAGGRTATGEGGAA